VRRSPRAKIPTARRIARVGHASDRGRRNARRRASDGFASYSHNEHGAQQEGFGMKEKTPDKQLQAFFAKYTPAMSSLGKALLEKMRARLPGAVELVYDNYNALVIAFAPSERASEAIFSIAVYPRWINLFFADGANLPDPRGLLQGSGKAIRHIVLHAASDFDQPAINTLMAHALRNAHKPLDKAQPSRIVIKAVVAKQRPRRAPEKVAKSVGAAKRRATE
jgi:hypothetical protein